MSSKRQNTTATARLKQDYMRIIKDPVPYILAAPLPSNILEWHYCVMGPEDSPYDGGFYHGKLVFPREFPFKPPSIYMITPNGRFKVNSRLCLSISDFHPDTWNPAWSVATILTGLLSFMLEKSPTFGSIETTDYTKRQLAAQSLNYNIKDKVFAEIFPGAVQEMRQILAEREAELRAVASSQGNKCRQTSQGGADVQNGENGAGAGGGVFYGAFTNLVVIVGFAAFAWTVKYILSSIIE